VKTVYATVNLEKLNLFKEGSTVTAVELKEAGLVKKEFSGVKILGNGTLSKKLTVKANAFSASAKAAIEKVGGTAEVIQ
jgi:large subunit ribosomal protein L15